ncbi:MAG: amidophosphoribosyltransferase [Candidatus Micrarchaeota archaeon]|nr:amidophosphoribosyltransferase [Candidatus Micrarchaeota archaeon]
MSKYTNSLKVESESSRHNTQDAKLNTDNWELREECGVVAIFSKKEINVAPYLYKALMALQHRGQDAAGLATFDGKKIIVKKGTGLVSNIFKEKDLKIKGKLGIGHTRYPTSGLCRMCDVQPFVSGNIAIAHNGHLANFQEMKDELAIRGKKFETSVDSEVIAYLLNEKLENGIENAVKYVMDKIDGAYSNVGIIDGKLIVFRDQNAIRPLVYGENEDFFCVASESAALDINEIPYKGEIEGGELLIIEQNKRVKIKKCEPRHCMFEYVYFARPDSIENGKSVYEVRKNLGGQLAREHPVSADVVIPVPDTARTAAAEFSKVSGIRLEEGLIKNRYIGRTFIMPTQEKRCDAVRLKLNPVVQVIKDKRIVLVDDSIVRGTTLREIVKLVRNAGAKEVHLRITCPPIKAPCFYGVNMSTYKELIANNKTIEEIREYLNVESLGYLSIEGLKKAIALPLCTGCLNEDYPTKVARELAKQKKDVDLARCG